MRGRPRAASESRGNPAVARLVLRALRPRHAGPRRRRTKMATRSQRRPTTEERDARRQAQLEQLRAATSALLTSEGWQRWLRTRSRFHRYSLRNTLLIAFQCSARDSRRRLPPLARTRPLRPQGREGDPHLRPRPLPTAQRRAGGRRRERTAARRLQARRRLRRLPDRSAPRSRADTARTARPAGQRRQPRPPARPARAARRHARLHRPVPAARRS